MLEKQRATMSIVASGVRKHYRGGREGAGLNGLDLEVKAGSIFGLLGPNGAGKTTTVKILTTLLQLDSGQAYVAGFNVQTQSQQVRERIGLVGQYAAVDELLNCRQNVVLFGRLNHLSAKDAEKRADELLEQFDLVDAQKMPASQLSGGMRRRLDLAVSLLVVPEVLFVDEPTTGLDPAGRREVWGALKSLAQAGTTILLTTQYLEEADLLAQRIAMLKEGKVITEGTPRELKAMLGGDWLEIVLPEHIELYQALPLVQAIALEPPRLDETKHALNIAVGNRIQALVAVATALAEAGIEPEDLSLRRPTLDEVFLYLTHTPTLTHA